MRRIRAGFRRIFNDITTGNQLESYATFLVMIGLIVFSVADDLIPDRVLLIAVLAGVSLLILNQTRPIEATADLDELLKNRTSFKPLRELIQNKRQLWIYAPSGINVLNSVTKDIKNTILRSPRGELRMVVQDNRNEAYLRVLTGHLDSSIQLRMHDLPASIERVSEILAQMQTWDTSGQVNYRYFPHSPGFSIVAIDAEEPDGLIIVEFHGVSNEQIGDRMHIELTRDTSRYWYDYWLEQYLYIWENAREPEQV